MRDRGAIRTDGEPLLSVATVAGAQRPRMRRLLEAVAAQTIAAKIEIVVVDCRPELGEIEAPAGLQARFLAGAGLSFGAARAMAARVARAEIVAFLEDHCYPEPGWAEALVGAFGGPWASVGYAVGNANPQRMSSRINYLAHYGQWLAPQRGPAGALPGNNVSYRRSALLGLGSELDAMLSADFNIHANLRRRGLRLASEPAARVRHENEESLLDSWRAGFSYARVLATERARLERWGPLRRAAHAAGILVVAPLLRLGGLASASARTPARLVRVIAYAPVILTSHLISAIGESMGYLFGPGSSRERLMYWEVDAPRAER